MRRVLEIGDPDRPTVSAPAGRERPEVGEVVAACGPARPHVVAAVHAARGVAGRYVDEVPDLLEVRGVGVGDDEEARSAVWVAVLRAQGADARAARLIDVVVTRVQRPDNELAPEIELHVLVLPVAVL